MTPNIDDSAHHDPSLELAVRNALDRYAPLRMWRYSFQIQASDGKATLTGNTRSQAEKQIAGNLARAVKGITSVDNQMIADGDLELTVAQALGVDERTRDAFPGILVGVVFGTVYLKGTAASEAVKKAAGEIAGGIENVKQVSNELVLPAKATA
ncbi:MAG TPA: BON domain-containing protein [Anaerolineae bacterium]